MTDRFHECKRASMTMSKKATTINKDKQGLSPRFAISVLDAILVPSLHSVAIRTSMPVSVWTSMAYRYSTDMDRYAQYRIVQWTLLIPIVPYYHKHHWKFSSSLLWWLHAQTLDIFEATMNDFPYKQYKLWYWFKIKIYAAESL